MIIALTILQVISILVIGWLVLQVKKKSNKNDEVGIFRSLVLKASINQDMNRIQKYDNIRGEIQNEDIDGYYFKGDPNLKSSYRSYKTRK